MHTITTSIAVLNTAGHRFICTLRPQLRIILEASTARRANCILGSKSSETEEVLLSSHPETEPSNHRKTLNGEGF